MLYATWHFSVPVPGSWLITIKTSEDPFNASVNEANWKMEMLLCQILNLVFFWVFSVVLAVWLFTVSYDTAAKWDTLSANKPRVFDFLQSFIPPSVTETQEELPHSCFYCSKVYVWMAWAVFLLESATIIIYQFDTLQFHSENQIPDISKL